MTLWRLRKATSQDEVRLLVQEKSDSDPEVVAMTPERIEAGTPLTEGERVRLTIEAPNAGYLYVIDREQYANGEFGEPYLIFPTTRTRGGNNSVFAGRLIEIPGEEDTPFYFTLRPSRGDQIGELLIIIVTPTVLKLPLKREANIISRGLVDQWQAKWAAATERFELVGGQGRPITSAERDAGTNLTRRLTQDEPLPQTLYRVSVKPGRPLLFTVPLTYKRFHSPEAPL